jgi:hypothetical protein
MTSTGTVVKVVISQSMYFPWVGLLEQIRLADCFIHYDDVQFTRGFYNRVQLKTSGGSKWLTIPTRDYHRGQRIDEVLVDDRQDWRANHLRQLAEAFRGARYADDALELAQGVLGQEWETVGQVSRASILALAQYFGLTANTEFRDSKQLGVPGKSSRRLLDLVVKVGGAEYITGHGAANYMDHEIFEAAGIAVRYMDYRRCPYPQSHGEFTPYVTGLDLVAHCGVRGRQYICSQTIGWKEFISGSD